MKTLKIFIYTIFMLCTITSCEITELYQYPTGNNNKAEIVSISLVDTTGVISNVMISSTIDTVNSYIVIKIKQGVNKNHLVARAVVSEGAIVQPAMGVYSDFTLPMVYTLTSNDRQTQRKWTVKVLGEFEIDLGDANPDEYDSGFDYDVDASIWTLDKTRSDEFNSLDVSKWSTNLWYTTSGDFAYNPNNVTVKDGKLHLTAKKENKDGKSFTGGAVKSSFEIGNNTYIKVRAKTVNSYSNVASSISLFGEPTTNTNPNPQINILQTPWAAATANAFTSSIYQQIMPGSLVKVGSKSKYLDTYVANDFHVYALERRDGYIRFYYDGEMSWEYDVSQLPELSSQVRNLILSIEGLAGAPYDKNLPKDFVIDYVKVYTTTNSTPTPTQGSNLLLNPSFELGGDANPPSWTVTRTVGNQYTTWVYPDGGYGGTTSRFGAGSSTQAFDINVSQTLTGLQKGVYRLEAWAYKTGNTKTAYIYVKVPGEDDLKIDITTGAWGQIVIENIFIDGDECKIGFHSVADGGSESRSWFDEFKFTKINF